MAADEGTNGVQRDDGSQVQVGDRLKFDVDLATVKFIGHIPSSKGVWLGVEWDNPSRGKHDGTHEGQKYFQTSHPTAGSFIRPKKAEFGVRCLAALQDRYGRVETDDAGVVAEELYVLSSKKKQTFVEMVGAKSVNEKQSKLEELEDVSLRNMAIYGSGPNPDLSRFAPNIQELDLCQNLLPSWQSVATIAQQLPNLRTLNISQNKLQFPDNPSDLIGCFPSLRCLYLNRMNYTWQEVLRCCSMFPVLEDLHVCFNNIKELWGPNLLPKRLKLLNLESNPLEGWNQILKMGTLQNLEKLIITENNIETIIFPECEPTDKTPLFPKLQSLCLNRNQISEWSSVTEMNKLQNLKELKMQFNPILVTVSMETAWEEVIARIGGLQIFNRTQVMESHRRGAEIDYLKKNGPEWIKAGGNEDPAKNNPSLEFLKKHPRYMELVKIYGAAEESEMVQPSRTLKDNLICVKIRSLAIPGKGVLEKKLPVTMTVQKLKSLVKRLFRVDNREITLSYRSQKMQGPKIDFDNEMRQISFYSVETGDTIEATWDT
ncbi:hypothetical protein ScPMuIL_014397 [Solemya velum]